MPQHPQRLKTRTIYLDLVRPYGEWALYVHYGRFYAVGPKGQVYASVTRDEASTVELIAREQARPLVFRSRRWSGVIVNQVADG